MIALPFSPGHRTPAATLAAGVRSRAEHQDRPAVAWGISAAPLGREQAVKGGESRLLADLRRDDPALYDHSVLVWALTQRLAASLGYSEGEQATVAAAALMHDVGKLTLPRTLLDKPTSLTPQEYALMQQHCAAGARLLKPLQVDEAIIELVYHHHERWDGQGYPAGLAGSAIPRGARLIAIADAFAVMTTPRPYQPARSIPAALLELERCAGTQFDPLLLPQCSASLRKSKGVFLNINCSLTILPSSEHHEREPIRMCMTQHRRR